MELRLNKLISLNDYLVIYVLGLYHQNFSKTSSRNVIYQKMDVSGSCVCTLSIATSVVIVVDMGI